MDTSTDGWTPDSNAYCQVRPVFYQIRTNTRIEIDCDFAGLFAFKTDELPSLIVDVNDK